MKAKDLARLLDGVHPDAEVYIDLGISHNKKKALVYTMLTTDCESCSVEHITMTCFSDGAREVYLCPYDGQYDLAEDKDVESFFEEHGLK
jgi:hypothetical protein